MIFVITQCFFSFLFFFTCCQADSCIKGPGNQRWFQAASEDEAVRRPAQHAADRHAGLLRVRQHGQLQPSLWEQLLSPQGWAEQCGGKPRGAVQHKQRLHRGHHTRHPPAGKHIAVNEHWFNFSKRPGLDWMPSSVTKKQTNCALTESWGNFVTLLMPSLRPPERPPLLAALLLTRRPFLCAKTKIHCEPNSTINTVSGLHEGCCSTGKLRCEKNIWGLVSVQSQCVLSAWVTSDCNGWTTMLLSVYISLKVHRYCKSRISISFREDNSSMTHILLPLSSEWRFSLIRRNVYNSSESFFLIFELDIWVSAKCADVNPFQFEVNGFCTLFWSSFCLWRLWFLQMNFIKINFRISKRSVSLWLDLRIRGKQWQDLGSLEIWKCKEKCA